MAEAKIYVPATDATSPGADLQPGSPAAQVHSRPAARQHLRVLELSRRSQSRRVRAGQPLLDHDRGPPRRVAVLGRAGVVRPTMFQQGIAGALELFFRAWMPFQQLVGEVTGHVVPVFQRVDQAGYRLPLDERVLADADTLLVFGLDHLLTEQEASPEEIEAVRRWLAREGTVLVLGPHHDVGISADMNERAMEYAHHGDALVPRQQRFGKYTRSLMKGLGVPVENRYGLRPGVVAGHDADRAADDQSRPGHARLARGRHELQLPQAPAALRGHDGRRERRFTSSGSQPIDLSRPHPFTEAGNREFNSFVWMPPAGRRAAARCCSPTRRSSARCSAPTTA